MATRKVDSLYHLLSPFALILAAMAGVLLLAGTAVRRLRPTVSERRCSRVTSTAILGAVTVVACGAMIAVPGVALPILAVMAVVLCVFILLTLKRSQPEG